KLIFVLLCLFVADNNHRNELRAYESDGIVFPIAVLAPEEVVDFRNALDSIIALCGESKRFDNLHFYFPWAYRLATHNAVLDAVETILGPDLVIDGTLVFYKPP